GAMRGASLSLGRLKLIAIDQSLDFRTAGSAIGPGLELPPDRLEAPAAGPDRGGDLFGADAEAGADERAAIGLAVAGATGEDRGSHAAAREFLAQLIGAPVARQG